MRGFLNLFGIGVVWLLAVVAWMVLGNVTGQRRTQEDSRLRQKVNELWGQAQVQRGPQVSFRAQVPSPEPNPPVYAHDPVKATLASSTVDAKLHSDPRRKGLVWYALYDVSFAGTYSYVHDDERPALVRIELPLPSETAVYDDLVFTVEGKDRSAALDSTPGVLSHDLRVEPHERITFSVGYKSRGIDDWRYEPSAGVSRLNAFRLELTTDFRSIDFPTRTLSPTAKQDLGNGWRLRWDFRQMVTGQGIGMVMPAHIQPGELASTLAFSAPVSLLFFFAIVFVLATLRKIDVHPINYLLIAAAFFAFHLLFAYSVDHISVEWAFAIASAVSVVLVVSYLRLVVSTQFALREAALAQLVYLVGFSLAHFWDGYTGLTITVLAIATLFVMMQLTGRVRWHEVLKSDKPSPANAPRPLEPLTT